MDSKCYKPIRIGRYTIRKSGRGSVASLPQIWLDDEHLTAGDTLIASRDNEGRLFFESAAKAEEKA